MKPVSLVGSWIIKAPLTKVYKIVIDFEQAPVYFPKVAKSIKIIARTGNHLTMEAITKTLGLSFKVQMETDLLPNQGFYSVNESILAIEHESFLMEAVPEGTKINYHNTVIIKNNFLRFFARLLIGKPALMFWEAAYIKKLQQLVE